MIEVICAKEPKYLEEAQGDDRWMEAMQSKYGSIMKNNTWDLVDRPPKCKVIGTKWVYKTKYKSDISTRRGSCRRVSHRCMVLIIKIPSLPQLDSPQFTVFWP